MDCQFIFVDGELLDVFGETGGKVLTVGMKRSGHGSSSFCGVVTNGFLERGDGRLSGGVEGGKGGL